MADDLKNEETGSEDDWELEFSHGDLVQMRSGGPPMTIEAVPGENADYRQKNLEYWCTWFKGATRDSDGFPEHVLQLYTLPSKT